MSALALVCAAIVSGLPDEAPIIVGEPIAVGEREPAIWGRWDEHVRLELAGGDALAAIGSTVSLGLDWTAGGGWEAALEGRLRHRLFVPEEAAVGGELLPELRRARLRWQLPGGPELALGLEVVRWGRTLARPFDVVSPHDLRDGPLGPEGGERVPVFVVSARHTVGTGALELLLLPFYRPALGTHPEASPAQDLVHSGELAARVTQRLGPLDLGLGWMVRFDRAPLLPRTSSADDALPEPERQHALGAELAFAQGALRLLAEAALFLEQRLFASAGLAAERQAVIRWGFDVGVDPAVFLELVVGLEGAHAPTASASTLYEGPDDVWLRARLGLMLAFDGVLRLDAETRVGLLRDDWFVTPALTWRATSAASLGLGVQLFGGKAVDGGLGALYDRHDHLWLRITWTL